MDIKEFAQKYIKAEEEAWFQGNMDALDEVDNTDVVYHLTPPMPDVVGLEAHKQFIIAVRNGLSDIHFEIKYLAGEGNLVAFLFSMQAVFTGEIPGLPPPTGKETNSNELWLFRLKNNKVAEAWMYGTTTGLF